MISMSRRLVFAGCAVLAATGALSRLYSPNTASATPTLSPVQAFFPDQDAAFHRAVDGYEKASANRIDLGIVPFIALQQKAVFALTDGDVPDLRSHVAPDTILQQFAWNDRHPGQSDTDKLRKPELSQTDLPSSSNHNSATKQRSNYLMPVKQGYAPFRIWGDLVEKAGFMPSDASKTRDARKDPHQLPFVQEAVPRLTIPCYNSSNQSCGQVQAEQFADVVKNGVTSRAAVDKAFSRAAAIFTQFTFG